MNGLTTTQPNAVTTCDHNSTDRNPAAVYLAGLAQGSRRTMRNAVDTIGGLLNNGTADAFGVDWAALRFQHTAAIRSQFAGRYAPATANKMLSALYLTTTDAA